MVRTSVTHSAERYLCSITQQSLQTYEITFVKKTSSTDTDSSYNRKTKLQWSKHSLFTLPAGIDKHCTSFHLGKDIPIEHSYKKWFFDIFENISTLRTLIYWMRPTSQNKLCKKYMVDSHENWSKTVDKFLFFWFLCDYYSFGLYRQPKKVPFIFTCCFICQSCVCTHKVGFFQQGVHVNWNTRILHSRKADFFHNRKITLAAINLLRLINDLLSYPPANL